MALNKSNLANTLKAALDAVYTAAQNPEGNYDTIRQDYCNAIAQCFDDYVKEMTITIPASAINVAGSSTNQTNPSEIILNGTVS